MRLNTFKITWSICIKIQNESDTNESLVPLHIIPSEGISLVSRTESLHWLMRTVQFVSELLSHLGSSDRIHSFASPVTSKVAGAIAQRK